MNPGPDGLRQSLDSMIALERRLEESLARLSAGTSGYLEAPTLISELHSLATEQRVALEAHREGLGDTDVPPLPAAISAAFDPAPGSQPGAQDQGSVAALRAVASAFADAAFGYEVLHGLAHRFFHRETADVADQHRRRYLEAAHALHQAVGDVVVQELQDAGHACRCECPACAAGICLCWHVHAEPGVTGPGVSREGIVVRAPRPRSSAEQAGLRPGDVILAVDGEAVGSYEDMLERMLKHQPGETVELRVRRGAGDPQELVITR